MTHLAPNSEEAPISAKRRLVSLFLGVALSGLLFAMPAPEGLTEAGWHTIAFAVLMISWWITEAMPLPVTALLPIVVLPALDIVPLREVTTGYAHPIIYLFLGGFILSAAMQKWNLHTRFAYLVLNHTARSSRTVLAGLMFVSASLSMWMSNTATIIMMLPIAMSIAAFIGASSGRAPKGIALGVAYAATIGGLATFIGTPTNALFYGHMETMYGVTLSLADWMLFGVPAAILMTTIAWASISHMFLRELALPETLRASLAEQRTALGPMSVGEKRTLLVFVLAVGLWLFGGALEGPTGLVISDPAVAIFAALALFLLPVDMAKGVFTLEWKDAEHIPWGVLVFFGGSLTLSAAFVSTGASTWLGGQLGALEGISPLWLMVIIALMIIAVSEMMSNVATISVFLPILSVLAATLNVNPMLFLLPATLAASSAFMLPTATAANALAYQAGNLRVSEMMRSGFRIDMAALVVIILITYTIVEPALGTDFEVVPDWAMSVTRAQ
jgi:sodium-dependent dicarboxylate transporter 2/3/5